MFIGIDQSGKIEDTALNTVIAFANSKSKSIFIDKREKRELQEVFRKKNKGHVFVFKTFAILIFLLIRKDLLKIQHIIIDIEYPGKDYLIKDYLLREIRKHRSFDSRDIVFDKIGRKSKAHEKAINVYRDKIKPDIVVNKKDILVYI